MFVDRIKELAALEKEYTSEKSSLFVLYGRRRIGKTTLIRQFISDKPAVYFLATEESEAQNRNAFKDVVATFTQNQLLYNAQIDNWSLIFDTLVNYVTDRKKVIVIDEFQYLGKANAAFPSIIQKIWDTFLINKNVMLILCGSYISMMESQTLSYESPLYGRRTGQIKLRQIQFAYYNSFFPSKSNKELIEYYAVTGGVPKYIELFHEQNDIYEAVEQNILATSSFLYYEPNFLLHKEVAEVGSYFSIIKTIAAGNHRLSKIASGSEIKETSLSKYLGTLICLDILEREVPITEKNPAKSKRGLYRIKDYYLLFWFKFVYPNLSYIESGNIDYVMNKIRMNFINNHVAYVYEDICRESIWQMNTESVWNFNIEQVGRWWDKNSEIDIVALDNEGGNIIFGECKYWEGKIGVNVLRQLEEKANNVLWKSGNRKDHFLLFSFSGYTDELLEMAKKRHDLILKTQV